ncbi:MAG: hypothetical protein Q7S33_03470 [Nanoarchaeota archaeon]|nr:hypothetical protein [Nanoarchaeota archaeon]
MLSEKIFKESKLKWINRLVADSLLNKACINDQTPLRPNKFVVKGSPLTNFPDEKYYQVREVVEFGCAKCGYSEFVEMDNYLGDNTGKKIS